MFVIEAIIYDIFKKIKHEADKETNTLTIKEMCELAGVSRSGYYNWIRSESTRHNKELRDEADFALILEAYNYRG